MAEHGPGRPSHGASPPQRHLATVPRIGAVRTPGRREALKAAIASTGAEPTRTHDLVYLALRAGRDLELALAPIDIATLSAVLARSRYPTHNDPAIGPDDAIRWVHSASQVVATCARHCKVPLESLSAA